MLSPYCPEMTLTRPPKRADFQSGRDAPPTGPELARIQPQTVAISNMATRGRGETEIVLWLSCTERIASHPNAQSDGIQYGVESPLSETGRTTHAPVQAEALNAMSHDSKASHAPSIVRSRLSGFRECATGPAGRRRRGIPGDNKRQLHPRITVALEPVRQNVQRR
jgi:hypothetical protein